MTIKSDELSNVLDMLSETPLVHKKNHNNFKDVLFYFAVTQVNLTEGYLVMSCTGSKLNEDHPIEERFYLVTVDDITPLKMTAKLVVISGGWTVKNLETEQRKLQALVNAFLMAGRVLQK